ncbi:hypothetical protein FPV67DRAFT_1389245, partial [Lyophyllum atratum]
MWLKSYLNLGPDRPLWASVADALFAGNVPRSEDSVDPKVRMNIFLQSWKSKATEKAGVCPDLLQLQSTAKKYGVRPEGLAFTKDLVRQRPIWFHSDADPKIRRHAHGRAAVCLRDNHGVRSVGDAERVAARLVSPLHQPNSECECTSCMEVENETGCLHPHECSNKAKALLRLLPPKWHPGFAPEGVPDDGEDAEDESGARFRRHIVTDGPLADIFRIFTTGPRVGELPDLEPPSRDGNVLLLAVKGCCMNSSKDNARAGAGIFCGENRAKDRGVRVPPPLPQSSQSAEWLAVKEVAESDPQPRPM